MQLKEFSLINPSIESAEVFKAIETAIPSETTEQAIGKTNSQQQRQRKLPSSLVISLVIAMSLWSSMSMRTVLKNLVNGLNQKWMNLAQYWQVPNSSSISEARMFTAAETADISPLRIGFTGTLNVIRRAIPLAQSTPPSQLPFF